ncbi:hypothetical protein [Singulisphaera acidiphila]|uniref:hypothetical protein n=1 Tax=Singulisphaera acidiphila TaxID=466153 RepID=UPI00024713DD|nr:hypothetical protein [Singulisphaera acidiphila]
MSSGSLSSSSANSPSAEQEFMQAIKDYQKQSGRLFPTWSEILDVAQNLGKRRRGGSALGSALPRS